MGFHCKKFLMSSAILASSQATPCWDSFGMNMNEIKEDWEGGKKLGGGGQNKGKKGRGCLPNLNLFDHALYVVGFVLYPGSPRE